MSNPPLAVAVLISGTGSNLKALIQAKSSGKLKLDFKLVISNREDAPGLDHAREAGIPFCIINSQNSEDQDREIKLRLHNAGAALIILAGYMRIIGKDLVNAFAGRMINLHPSLLPLYPGLNTYRKVLDQGDSRHGGSIHFVTAQLDGGPVISQVQIPVMPDDTTTVLAQRLAPEEHRLLLATVELFINGRVNMRTGNVLLDNTHLLQPLQLTAGNNFDKT